MSRCRQQRYLPGPIIAKKQPGVNIGIYVINIYTHTPEFYT